MAALSPLRGNAEFLLSTSNEPTATERESSTTNIKKHEFGLLATKKLSVTKFILKVLLLGRLLASCLGAARRSQRANSEAYALWAIHNPKSQKILLPLTNYEVSVAMPLAPLATGIAPISFKGRKNITAHPPPPRHVPSPWVSVVVARVDYALSYLSI